MALGTYLGIPAPAKGIVIFVHGSGSGRMSPLNRAAAAGLRCEHRLVIVPGASHLFEEPGTLDEVVRLATGWFLVHLRESPP